MLLVKIRQGIQHPQGTVMLFKHDQMFMVMVKFERNDLELHSIILECKK